MFLMQVCWGSTPQSPHLHAAGLRPAKGIKKEGGILIRFSFLSTELPSAAELLALTSSANSVSVELQGKQKTLETETMKPTEFPGENWTTRSLSKPGDH